MYESPSIGIWKQIWESPGVGPGVSFQQYTYHLYCSIPDFNDII